LGRAAMKIRSGPGTRERYFVVQEAHCLGFQEDREWSVEEWMKGEGLDRYNAMNDLWLEVLSFPRSLGPEKDLQRKVQMFFMASYNLDRFRSFVFEGLFLRRFRIEEGLLGRMAKEDETLLRFSFEWLKYSLYGEQVPGIQPV